MCATWNLALAKFEIFKSFVANDLWHHLEILVLLGAVHASTWAPERTLSSVHLDNRQA